MRAGRVGIAGIELALAAALAGLASRPAPAGACVVDGPHDSCGDPFGYHHPRRDVVEEQERDLRNAPPALTKDELVAGFAAASPGVGICGRAAKRRGVVAVDIVISRSGKIVAVTVRGAIQGTALGACVERAIRAAASFRPSSGATVAYAFALDPPDRAARSSAGGALVENHAPAAMPVPASAPAPGPSLTPPSPPPPPTPPPPPPPPAIEW